MGLYKEYLQYTGLYCSKHVLYRYLKSTVNTIQLISKFRVTSEEEVVSREKRLFGFWMEFFIETIKQESSGTQFPVCVSVHMSACIVCLYVCLSTLFVCISVVCMCGCYVCQLPSAFNSYL